jgi:hypothetical protein
MKLLETDWWTMELPPEWEAEQDDEVVVIEDEDGVSCLELSTLVREEGEVSAADLAEFSRELRDAGMKPAAVRFGAWHGEVFAHDDGEFHWREWFLRSGALFVYGAYHCLPENRGMDDAAIDEILSTLEPRPAGG